MSEYSEAEQRIVEAIEQDILDEVDCPIPGEQIVATTTLEVAIKAGLCALYRELAALVERRSDAGAVPTAEERSFAYLEWSKTQDWMGPASAELARTAFYAGWGAAITACRERAR